MTSMFVNRYLRYSILGEVQSKQLSRNNLAVVELDALAIICAETWYPTINTMTVGDVDQTLCKQKETVLLYMGQMVRKTR